MTAPVHVIIPWSGIPSELLSRSVVFQNAIGMDPSMLDWRTRIDERVLKREMLVWMLRRFYPKGWYMPTFPEIAWVTGAHNHSTVITAYQRYDAKIKDPAFKPTHTFTLE